MCPTGKCANEISTICDKDIEQGEGRIASCISDAISELEAGTPGELFAGSLNLTFTPCTRFSSNPGSDPSGQPPYLHRWID